MSKILSALDFYAEHRPYEIALRSGQVSKQCREMTYEQLSVAVKSLSNEFQEQGLQRIGLCLDNSIEWVVSDLAALQAGVTIVPIPLFFSTGQFSHLLQEAQIDALIVYHQWLATSHLANAVKGEKVQAFYRSRAADFSVITLKQSNGREKEQALQNIAKITYTSGSTGDPKGVCLTAETIEQVAIALHKAVRPLDLKKHLCMMPLATLLENIAGVYVPLLEGCMIHVEALQDLGLNLSSGLDTSQCIRALETIRPHSLIALPQFLQMFVALKQQPESQQVLSYLRFVAVGGAKTSPLMIQQALDHGLPVFEGYGLSECASVLCLNTPEHYRVGSVGKPLFPEMLTLNEQGEVIVTGQTMQGYLSNIEHIDQASCCPLNTGDVGYFDDDGFLFLNGRKKNLIISSFGRNISPEWVESELESVPEIARCVVFGEAQPFLIAVIVPASPNFDSDTINAAVRKSNLQLPDYAQVRQWVFTDEPFSSSNGLLTHNGRPKRLEIYKRYQTSLQELYVNISSISCNQSNSLSHSITTGD